MARGTVSNMIDRIQQQLDSAIRQESNWLAVPALSTDTTLTMQDELSASLRAGTILSVGRELMRVRTVATPTKEATVMRGWRGSTATAHAIDAEVHISPRFTRFDIHEGIVNEISSWGQKLFKVESYQTAYGEDDYHFELGADLSDAFGLVELRAQRTDDSENTSWPTMDYRLIRGSVGTWDQATTSGLVVRVIPNATGGRTNLTLHALVARPFDVQTNDLEETDDLVQDIGLEPSMLEVVELGVKMRVLGDAENGRSSRRAQDEPRRAEEVPPGAALTVAQTIRSNYERRLGDEVRRLQRKWKVRSW